MSLDSTWPLVKLKSFSEVVDQGMELGVSGGLGGSGHVCSLGLLDRF